MAAQGCDEIAIYVRSSKETIQMKIPGNATVKELKLECAKQINILPEKIKLTFAGKYLKDRETFKEKNIRNGFTVFLMLKPVIQPKDEQERLPIEVVPELEPQSDIDSTSSQIFRTINPHILPQWRQELLSVYEEVLGQMSTVLTAIFNPEILRSFNSQNINCTLLEDILRTTRELENTATEVIHGSAPLQTNYRDVLGQYLNIDSQNLTSNSQALRMLVGIAETPALSLDARITCMLFVFICYPELQNLPVDNVKELVKALLSMQELLQQVDMAIAAAAVSTNTLSSQASTATMSSTTMSDSNTSAAIANESESSNEHHYGLQLEELESMGFLNRVENLQTLISRSGNVTFAVDVLLKAIQDSL